MEDKKLGVINVTIRRWWCEHAITTILMISWYTHIHTHRHGIGKGNKVQQQTRSVCSAVVVVMNGAEMFNARCSQFRSSVMVMVMGVAPNNFQPTSIIILILHYRISTNRLCSIPSGALSQRYTYNVYATQHFASYHWHNNNSIIMTWYDKHQLCSARWWWWPWMAMGGWMGQQLYTQAGNTQHWFSRSANEYTVSVQQNVRVRVGSWRPTIQYMYIIIVCI